MKSGYSHIYSLSLGTGWHKLSENPYRTGLLIQNLSVNTVYISEDQDTSHSLELEPDAEYTSDTTKGRLYLSASAASSDVRIQEDVARN